MENRLKRGLGRGLSSLLGDASKKIETNKISIKDITRNKFQPRKHFSKENLEELTNSIKEQGIIQPIVVRPDKLNEGKYEIIAGERRWLAAQNAGLHEVPVVVLNVDDVKSLEFAIVENVQRQDLNPIEEAQGYQKLIDDFNYNQDKLSKFIGKSRSYIANSLRLLSLSDDILSIDTAMKTGYAWKYGPFELIDQLGADWFEDALQKEGLSIPKIIKNTILKDGERKIQIIKI